MDTNTSITEDLLEKAYLGFTKGGERTRVQYDRQNLKIMTFEEFSSVMRSIPEEEALEQLKGFCEVDLGSAFDPPECGL